MATLDAGDRAPAFTLADQDGEKVSLKDFAGRPVVVYFYPADDTPGCTKEACQFNDIQRKFESQARTFT
jgi:peroxiredoxin Q/BCP